MFKRLALFWRLMRGDAARLWRGLRHPHAPASLKVGAALLVLYVLSPVDFIPDFIPFFGALDDLMVVSFGLRWLMKRLPPESVA